MPTTASSAASVTSAFSCCTCARDRHHLAPEREREQADERHREERDRGELHVHEEEDDRDPDDHHQRLDALRHAPADEVADGVEVVRRARDDLAGRVPVVERARVAEVRLVEQLAHARLDADAGARRRVAAREVDPKRTIASTTTIARYGQSAARCPFVGAIASSIAWRMTIGIAKASPVQTNAHTSPRTTSRPCSRHSLASPFAVGQRLRSGGSTERKRLLTSQATSRG